MFVRKANDVRPAEKRCKCYCFYSYSTIDATPTLLHKRTKKGRHSTDGDVYDKHVFVSMGVLGVLSYSIHIQFFSQNQSLLSSIENQIFIKRLTEK